MNKAFLIKRSNADDADYLNLVKELDKYLAEKDGKDHAFYAQYNKSDEIRHVLIAYMNEIPAAIGAIKEFKEGIAEVKRMYTAPRFRGMGIATTILTSLETWASELSFNKCILETGKKQTGAIALYYKNGYKEIPNYGQYKGVKTSICFEKSLI